MSIKFDVFISYHNDDKSQAERLAADLQSVGIRVWFDEWELRRGKAWQDELDSALRSCLSVAVLIGGSGPGPWQSAEVRTAMSEYMEGGRAVIPVILPGAETPRLPPFLAHHAWVDCRQYGTSFQALQHLVRGITGQEIHPKISQFGDLFHLPIDVPEWTRRIIRLGTLPNPDRDALLDLTWDSFGHGINILLTQIKSYGTRIGVDACFGVNEAGLAMATFLSSAAFDRAPLGYVRCGKTGIQMRVLPHSLFPELEESPTIALFDFEAKQGKMLEIVMAELRSKYVDPSFYFIVFGAMTQEADLRISSIGQLSCAFSLTAVGLEDVFVAATMHPPGIEPPLGLR